MDERIFGLLPVVDRDGVPFPSVMSLDVTGGAAWVGDMVRPGMDCDGCLDAVGYVPAGSVFVGPKWCGGMQSVVCRDGWQ